MKAPLRYPRLTRERVERFRAIARAYHLRAFGEELARVNLELTEAERVRYLEWMRDNARRHGVKLGKPPPYGLVEESSPADRPK
jgi:hypothetical protein